MISLRAMRAAAGLVAIWCLGCTAFEPLLDQLIGSRGSAASCASMDDMASHDLSAPSSIREAIAPTDQGVMGCGCDHCVAVQTAPTEVAIVPQPLPTEVASLVGAPLTIDREPLVPPPLA